jgi:hypothetical protein
MLFYDPHALGNDAPTIPGKINCRSMIESNEIFVRDQGPAYVAAPSQVRTASQLHTTMPTNDYYKHLTRDLNRCFDDIESFVRHLEMITGYSKNIERDHRRRDKKSSSTFDITAIALVDRDECVSV